MKQTDLPLHDVVSPPLLVNSLSRELLFPHEIDYSRSPLLLVNGYNFA